MTLRDRACSQGLTRLFLLVLFSLMPLRLWAGDLTKADIERRFPPPWQVGEKLHDVPAWPLYSELKPGDAPAAYVFESIDIAPIPGFEGTPLNLLIAIDDKGGFIAVEVLREHEPVFLSGLGEAPLFEFVKQYEGKNLRQEIAVSSVYGNARAGTGSNRVVLDGVAKATVSVRIVNQTVLAAALAVARARLGFADASKKGPVAMPRADVFEPMSFDELVRQGYIHRLRLSNREVEQLFAGTEGAEVDPEALAKPDDTYVEIYIAYINAPIIGRNLFGDKVYAELLSYLDDNRPAFWVATRGRDALVDAQFVPGTPPPRLALFQGGLSIELRDGNRDVPRPAALPDLNTALILVTPPAGGLDPGAPMEFKMMFSRAKGMILPVVTERTLDIKVSVPDKLFSYPPRPLPEWLLAWQGRWVDLVVIGLALALLTAVLLRPKWISINPRRLLVFRWAFLAFTLGYIGWYAQGQLSIVQITGAIKSVRSGAGLSSFLYDPIGLLMIVVTLVSLVVWGRGTFCGWLCPFGALQEFLGLLAQKLRVPQLRLPEKWAKLLSRGRYALLGLLVATAAFTPALAEKLVEAEPFKTAITVAFVREWPYLLYCLILLVLGLCIYKFFCRFICPLGAALTLGGRLRRWSWLPRIDACGKPCQRCRHTCQYDAIERDGAIRYDECFQCLDCVGIYYDDNRCAPQLLKKRKGRVIRIHAAPAVPHRAP
jgi:transcriptional regulator of nitric oxide reductase